MIFHVHVQCTHMALLEQLGGLELSEIIRPRRFDLK